MRKLRKRNNKIKLIITLLIILLLISIGYASLTSNVNIVGRVTLKKPNIPDETGIQSLVKYAVQIYGIEQDIDSNGNVLGLTFGPASGEDFNNKYITHTYEETSSGSEEYYVKIIKHDIAEDRSETITSEYLVNTNGEKVTRTKTQKEKYDVNIHEMTWQEIKNVSDKTKFTDCMLCGDTKSVKLNLNNEVSKKRTLYQYGDGTGEIYHSIKEYYVRWNPRSQDNEAAINSGEYGTNAREAGGYRTSHIRATLIGKENSNPDETYAGDNNLSSTTCLYSCIDDSLRNLITAKKIKYVTMTPSGNIVNEDISDKIWLFSEREIYGNGNTCGNEKEGLNNSKVSNNSGVGYDRFANEESKYYLSAYNNTNDSINRKLAHEFGTTDNAWWLRSINLGDDRVIRNVNAVGRIYDLRSYFTNGIAFGFCIK